VSRRVLSLLAHPDDAEIFCGGVLILLRDLGWEVHIASMTPGDCGSRDLGAEEISRVRREEARTSAALIGGTYHCLESRDLMVRYDPPQIRATIELLRVVDPAIVITHSPQDYMLDHEFTSQLARNACFGAPIVNFRTEAAHAAVPTARIPHLYYCAPVEGRNIFGEAAASSLIIDITSVIERKAEMLACHRSQRDWLRSQHGMDEYIDSMRRWSAEMGAERGMKYAEGFRQHLGHPYPQDDLLGELLAGSRDFASSGVAPPATIRHIIDL
jgi:LmbE family N-acetylglucosaminyl deacetylase